MFRDRADAAKQLAIALEQYSGEDVVILGIPRGGVEIAYHVAGHLNADFSSIVIRKLGFPDHPEAAFGSVAEDGSVYLSDGATGSLTDEEVNIIIRAEKREITRRVRLLRNGKPLPNLTGKTVIIVDDGIATGATIFSAVSLCRKKNPSQLVVAAPIAAAGMRYQLKELVDEVVILETPPFFYAVCEGYENFENLTDDETVAFIEMWEADHSRHST